MKITTSAIAGLTVVALFGQTPTKVDYLDQLKNQPYLTSDNNTKYTTLDQACTAATTAGVSLVVGRRWTMTTQSVACDLVFVKGGMLVPSSGQTVTLTGTVTAPPFQIFDITAGGSVLITSGTPVTDAWFGTTSAAFYAACAAAVTTGQRLAITRTWSITTSSTCAANLEFSGGKLTLNGGVTATLSGTVTAPPSQVFNISPGGTVLITGAIEKAYPQWWGALANNSHDDTASLQACINAAAAIGGECFMPAGVYRVTALTLPPTVVNNWKLLRLTGTGNIQNVNQAYGSQIICTTSADCLSQTSTAFADNTYDLRNFSLTGNGTSSGNGIYICCGVQAAPIVRISAVSVFNFKGTGKFGFYLDGPEDSSLYDDVANDNYGCAKFSGAFNANNVLNFTCQQSTGPDGVVFEDLSGVNWVGGVIQSNTKSGMRFHGTAGMKIQQTHFENNNSSVTPGEGGMVFDSKGGANNQHIIVEGGFYASPRDNILTRSDGTANAVNVTIENLYMAGVATPQIAMDANTIAWFITGTVSGCTQVSDLGRYNRIVYQNALITCNGSSVQEFQGKVGINSNSFLVAPFQIQAASGGETLRVGSADSYYYLREAYNGGGAGPILGGNWASAGEYNLFTSEIRNPWMGFNAVMQLWSRTFAQMAAMCCAQTANGAMLYCSDCNSTCTAGGGTGQRCFRVNNNWTN
jgi:hypothetical protein